MYYRIYEKITPIKLALAGMAIHLFFSSLTQGIIILNEDSNTTVMFWLVGSLNGLKWTAVLSVMPLLILALIITMLLGRQLTIMELGRRYSERIRPEDSAYQNYSWPTCHRTSRCICFNSWTDWIHWFNRPSYS